MAHALPTKSERASAAEPALPSTGARHARATGIRQQISELTAALAADAASGQQALFASPRTARRTRPADTAAALHRLIAELTPHEPPRGDRHAADSAPVPGTGHTRRMTARTPREPRTRNRPPAPRHPGIRTVLISDCAVITTTLLQEANTRFHAFAEGLLPAAGDQS